MIGKTVEEIKAMKVKERDESHPSVPDVTELTSLVTMDAGHYLEGLVESFENKK